MTDTTTACRQTVEQVQRQNLAEGNRYRVSLSRRSKLDGDLGIQAAMLLFEGETVGGAARRLGIKHVTLRRWLHCRGLDRLVLGKVIPETCGVTLPYRFQVLFGMKGVPIPASLQMGREA